MKRIVILIFLVLLLAGCKGSAEEQGVSGPTVTVYKPPT